MLKKSGSLIWWIRVSVVYVMVVATWVKGELQGSENTTKVLRVVATIAPLTSFAINVAGDRGSVEMLYLPSQGPHDYAFSPSDIKRLQSADVLVMNGLELETGLDKLIESLGRKELVIVDASKALKLSQISEVHQHTDHDNDLGATEPDDGHKHSHDGINPHVWLDPALAISQVEAIAAGLTQADPQGAPIYRANSKAFIKRLEALDAKVREMLEPLPDKRIITFHDAFPYFANRYGIVVAEVFQVFPGREPTPGRIAELRRLMSEEKVRAVFAEPQYSPRLLKIIAEDIGVPVRTLDPMGTGKPTADFYEATTLSNAKTLVEALEVAK